MSDINIGAISEALNDKTDRDMRNVDTVGGADAVIEYQAPDPANDYKWYRKYASGWVEQGGLIPLTSTGWKDNYVITLPITMANDKYNINFMNGYTDYVDHDTVVTARTTTNFTVRRYVSYQSEACWEVKGMAA